MFFFGIIGRIKFHYLTFILLMHSLLHEQHKTLDFYARIAYYNNPMLSISIIIYNLLYFVEGNNCLLNSKLYSYQEIKQSFQTKFIGIHL